MSFTVRNVIPDVLNVNVPDEALDADDCLYRGTTVWYGINAFTRDTARAERLWLRALNGNPPAKQFIYAASNLGLLYHGPSSKHLPADGIPRNLPRAVEMYRRAIDGGYQHSDVYINLARILRHGAEGVQQNVLEAVHLYEHADDVGEPLASLRLAEIYYDGLHDVPRDIEKAMRLYRRAADLGHVHAMARLGYILLEGLQGVEKNVVEAVQWLEKATTSGNHVAMYNLADVYLKGEPPVEPNISLSKTLYRVAAEQGHTPSQVALGELLTGEKYCGHRDLRRGVHWLEIATSAGEPKAMVGLARILHTGAGGEMPTDIKRAAELYRKAIELGSTEAYTNLGMIMATGSEGVEKDINEAVHLYELAISHGKPEAMHNLANILLKGDGPVNSDVRRAVGLYRKAAELGMLASKNSLACILSEGTHGVEKNVLAQDSRHQ